MLDFTPAPTEEILLAQRALSDTEQVATPIVPSGTEAIGLAPPAIHEVHKSPGKAFIYNILLPGAGHLYAGNKRGFAHLGLEGAAWVTYFYYHGRGTAKEDEYLAYADDHWSYQKWQANYTGGDKAAADSLIQYFMKNNKQHYYEDIGKLPTYSAGWDDAAAANDGYYISANRNFYRGMRSDSNNFLKNARYAVVGSFVNRVVSAVDVLRMLKKKSNQLLGEDTHIRFKVRTKPFSDHTAVGFEIRKQL